MKIAIWHNLPSGGGKRLLHDHVVGLLARGHRLEAWRPPTADNNFLPLDALIPEHVVDLRSTRPQFSDTLGLTLEMARAISAMDEHCRACAEEIDRGGFDVLFANSCFYFATTAIGRYVEIPSALYLGEPYRRLYEPMPQSPWLALPSTNSLLEPLTSREAFRDWKRVSNLRVQAREEVKNAAGFSRILVNSYFSRESVLRAYGLDAEVCYPGIDSGLFVDRRLNRAYSLVGLGSLTAEKNARLCIEAIAKLPAPRPPLIWIANIAEQQYFEEMNALARSRDVIFDPRIHISDDELVDTLNRAMALLYAPRLEPFGLAPLEANACGLPVIAVAEGGVRETVIDQVNGLLIDNDPADMADAILRLVADPPLARKLGANGRAAVLEKWNRNAAIDRLEAQLARHAGFSQPPVNAAPPNVTAPPSLLRSAK
jgi:glycosyltransferase involved in cell wall biosynthesis